MFSSVAQSCLSLYDPMDCRTPGLLFIANSQSLLKLMSIELVMPSNHLILCHPLLLLPSIFIYVCIYIHIYIYILRNHLAVHMKHCGSTIFQVEKAEHYLVPIMWEKVPIMGGRKQWHPTPVFLPGKSHGRRSLVGCSPWGR